MKKALLITHKNLCQAFLEALEAIVGQTNNIDYISNENLSLDSLTEKLDAYCNQNSKDELFFMVEFKGGSPYLAARKIAMQRSNVFLLSGLNLPMLMSFAIKKDKFSSKELLKVLKTDAHRGISVFNKELGEWQ